jgi:hypothetical protein
MTRQRLNEIMTARHKLVRERILRNLAFSPAHAHMTSPEREKLADTLADEALAFPPPPEMPRNMPGLEDDDGK